MRRQQRTFGDGLIEDEAKALYEDWMIHADRALEDEDLIAPFFQALSMRHPKSRSRGREAYPAETAMRLMLLKHIRNWSYATLEREVRANLVYRNFTRVGAGKVPDAKTIGRWGAALGEEAIKQFHARLVAIAQINKVVEGRRMRVDTTVTETNIHYPTDSSLLGDGVRVLTRLMKKITKIAGDVGTTLRDRTRSVKLETLNIARAARSKATQSQTKLKQSYRKLLESTSRAVGQAKKFANDVAEGIKQAVAPRQQLALDGLREQIETMVPRVKQVMKQTRARIFKGDTRSDGKIFSIFEPSTEIIRKGKAGKPNEFGKVVKIQEAENQIVVDYEVYDHRPNDCDVLIPAIEAHQSALDRTPYLVAADAAFHSGKNDSEAKAMGVKRVSVPNRSTKSPARKLEQKKRWFRNGQKWRTGCEGRISVLKRRHGLNRCRYKGERGMKRWVGLSVSADTLINVGLVMAQAEAEL